MLKNMSNALGIKVINIKYYNNIQLINDVELYTDQQVRGDLKSKFPNPIWWINTHGTVKDKVEWFSCHTPPVQSLPPLSNENTKDNGNTLMELIRDKFANVEIITNACHGNYLHSSMTRDTLVPPVQEFKLCTLSNNPVDGQDMRKAIAYMLVNKDCLSAQNYAASFKCIHNNESDIPIFYSAHEHEEFMRTWAHETNVIGEEYVDGPVAN
jgi:hypothetical protein